METSNNLQEVLPIHNWKEEIVFNINKGNVYERNIDINFGEHHKDVSKLLIITKDGITNMINPHTINKSIQNIKWDIKGTSNSYWRDLDIYSITVIDQKGASQEIFCNDNIKFLKEFETNIGKGFK
jgi:hypothetical protein